MKIFRRIDIDSLYSCSKENEEELREPVQKNGSFWSNLQMKRIIRTNRK